MADQEIAKHTRRIWAVMTGVGPGFWHKLREMLLEIATIVFAVSMSIWLHSLGEHRHEQAQVKSFLLGLKRDIESDLDQMDEIVAFHRASDQRYAYLASLDPNEPPDRDKFNDAYNKLTANNFLVPRRGRYEGFKSSGKLTNIEDDALLEKIATLYEFDMPKVNLSSGSWRGNQSALLDYAEQALGEDDSPTARYKMITSPKGKRLTERMVTYFQLYDRCKRLSEDGRAIIADIDKAYPDQPGTAPSK